MRTLKHLRAHRNRRGAAVYVALFILIPIAALTLALVQVGLRFSRENVRSGEDERALFTAEAGLADAYRHLKSSGTGFIGTAATPAYFGHGVYWTEVDQVANALFVIRSSAMYQSGRAAVEQLVFRFSNSLFSSAIFSSNNLTIDAQALIDSFDSNLGTYASQVSGGHAGSGAIVASNGDITVDPSVEVHGDVHPGRDDSVTVAGAADVTGSLQPLAELTTLAPVTPPSIPATGSLSVAGTQTLPPGDYNMGSLEIQSTAHLTITGPARLIIGDWDVLSNSTITFDNLAGPVEIYITGDVSLASNSTIETTSESAVDLQLYLIGGPGQVADLQSNSDFYGAIYAPEGTVRIRSNFRLFGAVLADSVIIDSNAQIHYDEALTGLVPGFTFTRSAWTRTSFDDASVLADRRSPFQVLGVDAATLPSPEAAEL